eukprot:gene4077-1442_t
MTYSYCAGLCKQHGFGDDAYSGLDDCNMACRGDHKETCGGRYRINVYKAACKLAPPTPPPPPGTPVPPAPPVTPSPPSPAGPAKVCAPDDVKDA